MNFLFCFFFSFYFLSTLKSATVEIYSSCNKLSDGTYNIKFLEDDTYPVVSVKCSNGYAVLDYTLDNNIQDYFVSWVQWFLNTAGPSNDDDSKSLQWSQWFIPGQYDKFMKFILSPDCNTCEEDNERQIYGPLTTYGMTGNIFGCFWAIRQHNCDVDWETDECYSCVVDFLKDGGSSRSVINDNSTADDYLGTGICPHNVLSAKSQVSHTHDQCGSEGDEVANIHLKPSLGLSGKYCVCVQPFETKTFLVDDELINTKQTELKKIEEKSSISVNVELYQSDFEVGTYRIQQPGTYTIMEDITFHFNPNYDTPNSQRAWMPTTDQEDDYPGANDYRNPYFMGFFAGIVIESDDVTLDLNGHTLQMSEHFYYQQRWFTIIELSTQYFLPGQGIGNFGANPFVSSNVVIKNGVLGLTSHHGIHGNYNENIVISNIKVQNFDTHGIQLNGFSNVVLQDVEVGPTSSIAYFNGEYGHVRFLLPRYQNIADETAGQEIQFYGRDTPTTMAEIVDKMETELDLAWNYVVNGVELTENDDNYDLFVEAKRLFVNENGIPNGAAQYAIFLNTFGASVFTYNLYTGYWSSTATLENVKIHDMQHSMKEYVRMHKYASGNTIINPFNAPLDIEEMFDDPTSDHPLYSGNIILDAIMASNKLSDNWGYLQMQIVLNDFLVPWATGEDLDSLTQDPIQLGCNNDVMIHSGKGINGLRLDGIQDVTINNLQIYNLKDSSPVGSYLCGNYEKYDSFSGESGGHFKQTLPMQIGFSGNMNQAININAAENIKFKNVEIDNIESETGPSFGISIWPACTVELQGDITVSNIIAGSQLELDTYTYDDLPNKAPEACGVRVYYEYDGYTTTVTYDNSNIEVSCITGHVGCLGDTDSYTVLGNIIDEDECTIGDIPTKNILFSSKSLTNSKQKIVIYISLFIMALFIVYYYFFNNKRKNICVNNSDISYHLVSNGYHNYGSV